MNKTTYKTGLEFLRDPSTTAAEIAEIISAGHPPFGSVDCCKVACSNCWLAWLTTGEPPKPSVQNIKEDSANDYNG